MVFTFKLFLAPFCNNGAQLYIHPAPNQTSIIVIIICLLCAEAVIL